MKQYKSFSGQHDDFVHDVAYDHYGKRLATCSADHKIKIWSEGTGEWQCDAELEGHRGAVWKLCWSHPEFGQVLASCSFDQSLVIWEELDTPVSLGDDDSSTTRKENADSNANVGDVSTSKKGVDVSSRWHRVATLKGDGRESVNDMKFSPRHFGLSLATCSTDGYVRIFVADDVMNLENWTMSEKFQATSDKEEATSLSWNHSRFDSRMLVVGSTAHLNVWVKNETQRRWEVLINIPTQPNAGAINDVCWAPNLGRSYHLIAAAASNSETVEIWKLPRDSEKGGYKNVEREAELTSKSEVWRCEWNITGTVLATSGDDGTIRLWRKNFKNKWNMIAEEALGR